MQFKPVWFKVQLQFLSFLHSLVWDVARMGTCSPFVEYLMFGKSLMNG